MHSIQIVLAMLLVVAASGYLVRIIPFSMPLPLLQIALGAVISGVFDGGYELQPEVFFLLFLPPLLFLDGWRIPKQGLFRDKNVILELALGLVVFTVLGIGFLIHWMIPTMPLPLAFALAAILSPTDPVALSSITSRVPIPKRMMHILEGESLLNDATGLVCFQFAVAAVLTGNFSLATASLTFVWVLVVGLSLGIATTYVLSRVQRWVWRHFGGEPAAAILVNLLTPFAAYLLAESMQASGILAAVAAGITMSYVELSGNAQATIRVQRWAVWETVQFTFNGIIFVLLGEQLPGILDDLVHSAQQAGHMNVGWLLVDVAVISAGLMLLRFLWVWLSLQWNLFKAVCCGKQRISPPWQIVVAMSLSGVRGAVTLAGVLTLPLLMPDGTPLPARQLVIFLAASVILVSLLLASVALPYLLRGLELPEKSSYDKEEDFARKVSAQAALEAVERLRQRLVEDSANAERYNEAAHQVSQLYQRKLGAVDLANVDPQETKVFEQVVRRFRQVGLAAERDELFRLAREHNISDELLQRMVRNLDLIEARRRS
ncbi:Na+/H+ antiporter [Xylella fastidiosa]|uniref:Na+/H+ antiporter n=1 Tax=Xylella fastidiosa subsp. multiplex TaxID=644357 RepID=A0A9Q4MJ82_XYLFS|nr:Na+/H+ antiporter [Xylella fastidiosa]MBE0268694.1 Na+/H+ antiporter [Xylella fastidiosa subsp. multiplex]MBE0274898.1 Na+/H+ antiporter [Xylella fastidiosa subsp. multiplex]MBE0277182.1 Na+/H+ antiporter [Xylella fastidiosa subsp. multiplex]MBE0281905.1 Na+/H+ antiporter [Xylella fastidiosa subsp. multiplex]MBS9446065.1 Na+/H+ antiporter [Xylella fastidiosa subsp. multiplex]